MVRGRHTLKVGVDIRRIRLNNSGNTLTTSSIDLRHRRRFHQQHGGLGQLPAGRGRGRQPPHVLSGLRRRTSFKATPNLTLNLGLRYEYYSVAHEILNRSAVVDILGCGGFCPKGTPYYDPNTKDFGPRVGLAWAPAALHGQDHHPHRLRHLLRRQPERRFQRSGRERRAALLALVGGLSRPVLSAGCIPRSREPALQPQGDRPPPQGPLLRELGFHDPAAVAARVRSSRSATWAARDITCSTSTPST